MARGTRASSGRGRSSHEQWPGNNLRDQKRQHNQFGMRRLRRIGDTGGHNQHDRGPNGNRIQRCMFIGTTYSELQFRAREEERSAVSSD